MTESTSDTLTRSSVAGVLTEVDAVANLAVRDLKPARDFYEETLGFEPIHREGEELIVYRSGNTAFNVYRSGIRRNQPGDRTDLGRRRPNRGGRRGAQGQGHFL